jgi:hypothetical protein
VGDADGEEDRRDAVDEQPADAGLVDRREPAAGRIAAAARAALLRAAPRSRRDRRGKQRQSGVAEPAEGKAGADRDALGLAAVMIGVADRLDQAPDAECGEAQRNQPDQDGAEGLSQQRLQRACGAFRLRPAEGGKHGEEADDEVDEAARRIAGSGQAFDPRAHQDSVGGKPA